MTNTGPTLPSLPENYQFRVERKASSYRDTDSLVVSIYKDYGLRQWYHNIGLVKYTPFWTYLNTAVRLLYPDEVATPEMVYSLAQKVKDTVISPERPAAEQALYGCFPPDPYTKA